MPRSLGERILHFLRAKAPDEFNSKAIAYALKANESSVRKELSRLLKRDTPVMVKDHRGFYRAKLELPEIRKRLLGKPILLHGIKVEGRCLNPNTKLLFEAISTSKKHYRKRDYYTWAWEGRSVSTTLHQSGFVELWLNTSSNPVDYLAFGRFRSWLEGRIPEYIGDWELVQVDISVDSREFNVTDFKGMRFKVFDNAWLHLYQKTEDILRIEVSMTPRELKFFEAVDMMKALVQIPIDGTYQKTDTDRWDTSFG